MIAAIATIVLVVVNVTSSNTAVGRLVQNGVAGSSGVFTIVAGQSVSVANVLFSPEARGTVVVSGVATDPTILETTAATVTVNVN